MEPEGNKYPEQKARDEIDKKLKQAGWVVQGMKNFNRSLQAVAVREFPTNDGGAADYALFIRGTPVGLIEAKKSEEGVRLFHQASKQNLEYARSGLLGYDPKDLRFIFEATDVFVQFTDLYDPEPRTRTIFSFYRPEHLEWLIDDYKECGKTLRKRMQEFPELPKGKLRDCQWEAITNLEDSLAHNDPRALIHMTTAAGKTRTATTITYRLLKHAGVRRVLFLVDTNHLGTQAERDYNNYQPYDSPLKLSDSYKVLRIQTSYIPDDTRMVCVSTIQRLYSMLKGRIKNFPEGYDDEPENSKHCEDGTPEVEYNDKYPPEFFDVIFIDECHRSIYNLWRQVLEYFDAFLIGLSGSPYPETYSFFQKVVCEYTHEQAVRDGVNVGALGIYVIKTKKTEEGGTIEASIDRKFLVRDKRTLQQQWKEVAEEDSDTKEYAPSDLNNDVLNESSIRLILQTFRDNWNTWDCFRGRKELPKTLIFAMNDLHASDIVRIAREVFGKGNEFCKKITYKSEEREGDLLTEFGTEYPMRIAVTVSKLATGTDVPAIEILLFMRNVGDANYYEQMLGRARRTVTRDVLMETSANVESDKLGYVIVDAAGVTESKKLMRVRVGGDMMPSTPFKKLLNSVANFNDFSDEALSSLGDRIGRMGRKMSEEECGKFKELSRGVSIHEAAYNLKNAYNPDEIEAELEKKISDRTTEAEKEKLRSEIIKRRCNKAAEPFFNPALRDFLMTVRNSNDQTIDPSLDSIQVANFSDDIEVSDETIRKAFREFIDQNKDKIDALAIIYNVDFRFRHITRKMIEDLHEKVIEVCGHHVSKRLFRAYKKKAKTPLSKLEDIIQIIRYEWGQIENLIPFSKSVDSKYNDWIWAKNTNKKGERGVGNSPFTLEQTEWLKMMKEYIAVNASMDMEALNLDYFRSKGGASKYYQLFGDSGKSLMEELNEVLVA